MLKQWGRSAGYMALAGFSAPFSMAFFLLILMCGVALFAAGLGFVLFPIVIMTIRLWTDMHRGLAGWVLGAEIQPAFQPLRGGVLARVRQVITDSTTWRDLAWLVVHMFLGFGLGILTMMLTVFAVFTTWMTVFWWTLAPQDTGQIFDIRIDNWAMALAVGAPIAVGALGLAWFGVPFIARVHAIMSKLLLSQSKLAARVEELAETRAGAVNAHDAELRRIERDLHDGTQARLVSIAMRLGVAEKSLDDKDPVSHLVREAREGAEQAMGELRDVIRTMYPPILTDRGLDGALAALGARCPVPTVVETSDLGRVPAPVEAAAYFVVAEALTNVTKHSHATAAVVRVTRDECLRITVSDNGFGGVNESHGTGILGMRRRVAALDGTLAVDSPPGGPTVISVEVPCVS
ncbi:signal transduction histidine kinase [Kibdelosporangium banguiense]|uniref:histidine kinase n=1 Tax=Kibdelosporangium banguiense TaxID=1365924 RepID=A0ABS4TFR2_9PSEU|nr:sensor histidine kinase [Kibdelosporangium banguiense]MBP2323268.1 signal transduction histidine kinase [Kibdelosporangium banguiense]